MQETRINIQTETLTRALFDELLPLAQKCWEESTVVKAQTCAYYGSRDFQIEPDFDAYQDIANKGALLVLTVRDAGQLKGYMIGILYRTLHHKKILCGMGDSIYIEPSHRAYTGVVAEKFEGQMRELGAQIIGWPTHIDGPVYGVLKARGYVGDDIVMEKRLCV